MYKKNLLRADRQDRLNSIKFLWKANQKYVQARDANSWTNQPRRDAQWKAQFDKLQEFHREHGHFHVPNHYKKDVSLGIWVSNQRSTFNRGQLPENRKALLDSIGFVWRVEPKDARASLYKKQWELQLEGLIQYKMLYGNCDVPDSFEKKGLAAWVAVQKEAGRKGCLNADRADKLLSTGLTWKEEREPRWIRSYVKLQGFLITKGVGSEVPFEEISAFDCKLGNWTKLQNVMKKHDKLPPGRVCLLENIGYKWDDAKMVVSQIPETRLHGEPKFPSIPFVPDFALSGPETVTKKPKSLDTVRRERNAGNKSSPLDAVKRHRPPAASSPAGLKRQIGMIRGNSRRGRDPPGDPPGKRVRLTMGAEEPIPMVVRSDPPGAPPCEVLSSFRI